MSFKDEIKELNENRISKVLSKESTIRVMEDAYNNFIINIVDSIKYEIKTNIANNNVFSTKDMFDKKEFAEGGYKFGSVDFDVYDYRTVKYCKFLNFPCNVENFDKSIIAQLRSGKCEVNGVCFIYSSNSEIAINNLYSATPAFFSKQTNKNIDLTNNALKFYKDVKRKAIESEINIQLYFQYKTFYYLGVGSPSYSTSYRKFNGSLVVVGDASSKLSSGNLYFIGRIYL